MRFAPRLRLLLPRSTPSSKNRHLMCKTPPRNRRGFSFGLAAFKQKSPPERMRILFCGDERSRWPLNRGRLPNPPVHQIKTKIPTRKGEDFVLRRREDLNLRTNFLVTSLAVRRTRPGYATSPSCPQSLADSRGLSQPHEVRSLLWSKLFNGVSQLGSSHGCTHFLKVSTQGIDVPFA